MDYYKAANNENAGAAAAPAAGPAATGDAMEDEIMVCPPGWPAHIEHCANYDTVILHHKEGTGRLERRKLLAVLIPIKYQKRVH